MGRLANRLEKRAGIAVLGTVAEAMAKALDEGMPGVGLVAVSMSIENIPTENPQMGSITAQSVLAMLRMHNVPMRVGT
ncbi:hypothetical protein ACU4HD_31890 [Cupriavidus basilensis]